MIGRSKNKARPEKAAATRFDPGASVSGKRDWIFGLILVFAMIIAYQPVWNAGFIWDDDVHLTKNPCIVGPAGFEGIWTSSAAVYYPLVLTSFWMQHTLWGLHPLPYHLANVVMHAACAILLWRVLLCLQVRGAWLGAALWSLHPVQVESAAWITELKNTQSCLFYLLAIFIFLKWRAVGVFANRKGREWYYALALLCALLAILSKASTVMLPVVLGLCWWWMDGRWRWLNSFRLVPFFVISAAASGWTIWEQKFHSGAMGLEWAQTWPERLVISGKDIWFYLGKLLWPHPLIFIYPRWTIDAMRPAAYLPVAAIVLTLFILWQNRRRGMWPVFFAFAYFLVSLFPALDFFNVYFFRYSFVGDHFQYLASIGPLALAAAGITTASGFLRERNLFLKPAFCGALLLTLGVLTWRQCAMYRDIETLWQTTIRLNPDSFLAHNNLGVILLQQGKVGEGIVHCQKALQIKPDYAEAHNNLGNALLQKGNLDDAIAHFEKALEIDPDYENAHYTLGNALLQKGRVDEAITHFQKALAINSNDAEAHNDLGNALLKKGNMGEAITHYQMALQITPDLAETHNNLGNALIQKGRMDEAITHFQKALQIKPDNAEAHMNLGNALLQKGNVEEAIVHYQKALQIKPDYAIACYNLGNALFQKGNVDEAITHCQKALAINPDFAEAHYTFGNALLQKGNVAEAIVHYQKALQIKPDYLEVQDTLAWVLATTPQASLRNGNQAVELTQQANQLAGGENPFILHTLAAAYAEAGRFSDAQRSAQKAMEIAKAAGKSNLVEQLNGELRLYAAGLPFHQESK